MVASPARSSGTISLRTGAGLSGGSRPLSICSEASSSIARSARVVQLRFYAIATHVLHEGHGAHTWTVAGHYEAEVAREDNGWRLNNLAFHPDWGDGNQQLGELATARIRP